MTPQVFAIRVVVMMRRKEVDSDEYTEDAI
jgi:hypothetical protein